MGHRCLQCQYPAIAIEIQAAIGARGVAFDVTLGCSSATAAVQIASNARHARSWSLFYQAGRRVFREVVPAVAKFIADHLATHALTPAKTARFWLHQATQNMNLIAERLLGRSATPDGAPLIIGEYGNTASAGAPIAFSLRHADLAKGAYGVLCSFGAARSARCCASAPEPAGTTIPLSSHWLWFVAEPERPGAPCQNAHCAPSTDF